MKLEELKTGIVIRRKDWPDFHFLEVHSVISRNDFVGILGLDEEGYPDSCEVSVSEFTANFVSILPEDEKPKNWFVVVRGGYRIFEKQSGKDIRSKCQDLIQYLELPEKLEWKYPPKPVKPAKKKKAQVKK